MALKRASRLDNLPRKADPPIRSVHLEESSLTVAPPHPVTAERTNANIDDSVVVLYSMWPKLETGASVVAHFVSRLVISTKQLWSEIIHQHSSSPTVCKIILA